MICATSKIKCLLEFIKKFLCRFNFHRASEWQVVAADLDGGVPCVRSCLRCGKYQGSNLEGTWLERTGAQNS